MTSTFDLLAKNRVPVTCTREYISNKVEVSTTTFCLAVGSKGCIDSMLRWHHSLTWLSFREGHIVICSVHELKRKRAAWGQRCSGFCKNPVGMESDVAGVLQGCKQMSLDSLWDVKEIWK